MTGPRWPSLADLELLVTIASAGSLGAAARQVGMAQPNASRAVRNLERDLGVPLVHRSPTGSTLTAQGDLVAEWSLSILRPAQEFVHAVQSLRAGATARLTVSASRTVAEYAVPGWLGALRASDPEVSVQLTVANSTGVFDDVRAGRAALGFVESPTVPRDLHSALVGTDRLVTVVAPSHPWARRRRPVTASELAATPLVVREPGSGTRATLEDALRNLPVVPAALELSSNEAVRISATSGAGPAVLSELAVAAATASGALAIVPVDGLDLTRRLRAVWATSRPSRPAGELLRIALAAPIAVTAGAGPRIEPADRTDRADRGRAVAVGRSRR